MGAWVRLVGRNLALIKRTAKQADKLAKTAAKARTTAARQVAKKTPAQARPAASTAGRSSPGVALGPAGARRFTVFRPAGIQRGERLPLLVMLHGCQQDAAGFALCTRMNAVATRERFIVLYPDPDLPSRWTREPFFATLAACM